MIVESDGGSGYRTRCNFDEGDGCVLSELDEDEAKDEGDEREWGEGHQYVWEGEGVRMWDESSELEEKGIRWDMRRKVSGSGTKYKVRGMKEVSMR